MSTDYFEQQPIGRTVGRRTAPRVAVLATPGSRAVQRFVVLR